MKSISVILLAMFVSSLYSQISQITNFNLNNPFDVYVNYNTVTAIGNTYYFTGPGDAQVGNELWKTDGTEAGTMLVKDISPGAASTEFNKLTVMNNILYFIADTETYGIEVWRSDGTEAGTYIVKDINPGSDDALNIAFDQLVVYNNKLYFSAYNEQYRGEIWVSDGTEAGTKLLKDVHTTSGSNPDDIFVLNNSLYFFAESTNFGPIELWKSDGTTAGTVKVKGIDDMGEGSSIYNVASNGTIVYFTTSIGFDYQLWSTDGTATNTKFITNIDERVNEMVVLSNGKALFTLQGGNNEDDLWVSDGTAPGTKVLKDFNYFFAQTPYSLVKYEDHAYILANDEDFALVVKTDGTTAGTTTIAEFETTTSGGDQYLVPLTNELLIIAYKSFEESTEIYTSKGTAETTKLLSNLNEQFSDSSEPSDFVELANGNIIFKAEKITNDRELFLYTRAITDPLVVDLIIEKDITCHNDADGEITASVTGGVPPYEYRWANNATTATIKNVDAGTYDITVTDASGNLAFDTILLINPSEIIINAAITPESNGNKDGKIVLTVSGGVSPYTYVWDNNKTTGTISDLAAANYKVTVIDANGCESIKTFIVDMVSSVNDEQKCVSMLNNIVYNELIINSCNAAKKAAHIVDGQGRILYKTSFSTNVSIQTRSLVSGMYYLNIYDEENKVENFKFVMP